MTSDWFRDRLVEQEKVRLLSGRLLSTSDWFRDRRVGRVSLVAQQVEKVRLSGRGALARCSDRRLRLAVGQVKMEKVKLGGQEALAVTRLEMEARSLDG